MTSHEQRRVWLQDKELAWVKASVLEEGQPGVSPRIITVLRDDGQGENVQVEVDIQTGEGETVKARNLFEDDSDVRGYESVHDLTNLTHLHEAEILEALCVRFQNDQIYTYTGPILLAVNPFKELKIYTEDILGTYYSAGLLKAQQMESPNLRPHVFAIADAAYRNLMETSGANARMDQSILVSGESGAGKTESTKYVMRYLATVARAEDADPSEKGRAERVLESNPILESFGNARTNRNDNSSRFGKFIQMSFDAKGFLVGAQIATYLLEKVRLTKQANGERNFHVFYQMLAGASDADREKWRLTPLEESLYTNQSDVYDRRDGVMDADQFVRTDEAFTKMKFTPDERDAVYSVTSAVMNIGNIELELMETGEGAGSKIGGGSSPTFLKNVADLLAVNSDLLVTALTTKKIITGNETFVKPLDPEEAGVVRDALAKTIYSRMFDWIVKRVNLAISTDSAGAAVGGRSSSQASKQHSFIGVLDIFGFEVFQHNSFEQLCINYANETLQQQFNEFVFQLEQKLYESEKIKWAFIDFPDNKPVLDLIEGNLGILALLDDQCKIKGTDQALANKLYEKFAGAVNKTSPAKAPANASPGAPPGKSAAGAVDTSDLLLFASSADRVKFNFCVRHYAGVVTYSSTGFVAKNKDELREEVLALMRTSTKDLVIQLFPETSSAAKKEQKGGAIQSETVGSQFKGQLASLLKTIKATSPHYIRCLKPNDQNVRDTLLRPRVVDQLRYGGVLEAVKVARAGYPTRYSLRDFVRRYFMLAANMKLALSKRAQTYAADDERWLESCEMICNGPEKLEKGTQFQIGRTKVFMRKSAFEKLETARGKVFKSNSTEVQKIVRGFIKRRLWVKTQKSVKLMQRIIRGFLGRRRALAIRKNAAATKLQSIVRQFVQRSRYMRMKEAAVFIQKSTRGHQGRKKAKAYRIFVMATKLQCLFRRVKARRAFVSQKQASIVIQTRWRGLLARRMLKHLREELRNVGVLHEKISELQTKLTELQKRNTFLEEALAAKSGAAAVAIPVVAVAAVKGEVDATSRNEQQHLPPFRKTDEEPHLKKRPPPSATTGVELEELVSLRERVETQAQEIARLSDGGVPQGGDSDKVQATLETTMKERDLRIAEVQSLKEKLDMSAATVARLTEERDGLANAADPEAHLSKALAERDAAQTTIDNLKQELAEAHRRSEEQRFAAAAAATTVVAHQGSGIVSSSEAGSENNELVEQLKQQLDSLAKAQAQELSKLREEMAIKAAVATSDPEHAELEHVKRELDATLKEKQALVATVSQVRQELKEATEERDSLSKLLVSPDAGDMNSYFADREKAMAEREKAMATQKAELEVALVKLTEERDRLTVQVSKEREEVARLSSERDVLTSLSNASSDDERMKALSEREALIEQERQKLKLELDTVTKERDALQTKLEPKELANGESSDNLELQLAKSTTTELVLAREVLTKENEDLKEERLKLLRSEEELKTRITALQDQLNQATAAKKSFFTRAPSAAAVLSAAGLSSTPSSPATATGDAQKSLPTRSDLLATRCNDLEVKVAELSKQKDDLLEKVLNSHNENNNHVIEIRRLKHANTDLNDKIEAMSLLAETTSAIKIKLARRLDSLIQENTTLKQSLAEAEDQLAAKTEVSRVLNDELLNKSNVHERNGS